MFSSLRRVFQQRPGPVIRLTPHPSPVQTPAQGAGLVQFYGNPVQVVDIGGFSRLFQGRRPIMIELAYFANPPASKASPSDAPLTHGLLVPMLIPSTTIPLYRLTMHECPSTVRAISESGGRFPGKFAGGPSRRPHCPNGHHDIDLQIGGFGHPRRGVHVLRRHHRLLCGHHLQLGLHRERSRLKRRMNAPSLLPHPKNKSAPRAVACEAESVLLTALGKGRKNQNQLLSLVSILIP